MSMLSPLSRNLCRGSIHLSGVSARNEPARRLALPTPRKRILFASAHSIVDFSNGASVATLDVLQGLTPFGFECHAFCTPKLDLPHEACFERIIAELREPYQDAGLGVRALSRAGPVHPPPRRADHGHAARFDPARTPAARGGRRVLEFFRKFLDVLQPDVMLTYGGDPSRPG